MLFGFSFGFGEAPYLYSYAWPNPNNMFDSTLPDGWRWRKDWSTIGVSKEIDDHGSDMLTDLQNIQAELSAFL